MSFYTASDILAHVRAMASDETETYRWSNDKIYRAVNAGLRDWGTKVGIPWLYSVPDDWSNTYEYALPAYMDGRIRPQIRDTWSSQEDTRLWHDLPGWRVEDDGSGGHTLQFTLGPVSGEGRIWWYLPAGHITPATATLDAELLAAGTSLTLTLSEATPYLIDEAGWVKIDNEWLGYAGVAWDGLSATLSNLVRGLGNTTAADHVVTSTVHFGLHLDRPNLLDLLTHQTLLYLHMMPMGDAGLSEKDHHSVMIRFHQDMIEKLWRRIKPARKSQLKLSRNAMGDMGTAWN